MWNKFFSNKSAFTDKTSDSNSIKPKPSASRPWRFSLLSKKIAIEAPIPQYNTPPVFFAPIDNQTSKHPITTEGLFQTLPPPRPKAPILSELQSTVNEDLDTTLQIEDLELPNQKAKCTR